MDILPSGSRPSTPGSADYFTGAVSIEPVVNAPDTAGIRALLVTFEPGARTAWHTHPLGQILLVQTGLGLAQSWGGEIIEIRPGDIVRFAPGEKHWHGAAPETQMCHLAMQEAQNGMTADWLEHVSDDQYHANRSCG